MATDYRPMPSGVTREYGGVATDLASGVTCEYSAIASPSQWLASYKQR